MNLKLTKKFLQRVILVEGEVRSVVLNIFIISIDSESGDK